MKNDMEVHECSEVVDGFNFQEGFASWTDAKGIKCATSGWLHDSYLYIYRLIDGYWIGSWEWDIDNIATEAIKVYHRDKAMGTAIVEAEGLRFNDNLFITDEEMRFTDVVPGHKCSNGGEYGFYTVYTPTSIPGVYAVRTETTCDFSRCETGPIGFVALSISVYESLRAESDRIEAEGFQAYLPLYKA